MSEDISSITGPMSIKRSFNNIMAALNIAQGKAAFNLRESTSVFISLQKLNEFVNKYEHLENEQPPKNTKSSSVPPESKPKPVKQPTLPDINLVDKDDIVEETIEI